MGTIARASAALALCGTLACGCGSNADDAAPGSAGASGSGTGAAAGGGAGAAGKPAAGASGAGASAGSVGGAAGSAGQAGASGAGSGGSSGSAGSETGGGGAAGSAGVAGGAAVGGAGGDAGASGAAGTSAGAAGMGGAGAAGAGAAGGSGGAGSNGGSAGAAGVGGGGAGGASGVCGDGVRDAGEACDGNDLGGATCDSAVQPGATGTVTCSPLCQFSTAGCSPSLPSGPMDGLSAGAWPILRATPSRIGRSLAVGPRHPVARVITKVASGYGILVDAGNTLMIGGPGIKGGWFDVLGNPQAAKGSFRQYPLASLASGDAACREETEAMSFGGSCTYLPGSLVVGSMISGYGGKFAPVPMAGGTALGQFSGSAAGNVASLVIAKSAYAPTARRLYRLALRPDGRILALGRGSAASSFDVTGPGAALALYEPDATRIWETENVHDDVIPVALPDGSAAVNAPRGITRVDPSGNIVAQAPFRATGEMAYGADGTLYAPSNGVLLAIDSATGTVRWSRELGVVGAPAVDGEGAIYVGTKDGTLFALRPDGTTLYRLRVTTFPLQVHAIGGDGALYVDGGGASIAVEERTAPTCGNGVVDAGEACDPLATDAGPTGTLCTPTCTEEACGAACAPMTPRGLDTCGDGVRNGTEACDGADLGTATCASVTGNPASTGALVCTIACNHDTHLCSDPRPCGDVSGLAASPWPSSKGCDTRAARSSENGPDAPTKQWELTLPVTGSKLPIGAVGADGTLYVRGGTQLCGVTPTGTQLFCVATSGALGADGGVAVGANGLIYTTGKDLQAFSSAGALVWSAPGYVSGPVIAPDGTVIVRSTSGVGAFTASGAASWSVGGTDEGALARAFDGTVVAQTNDKPWLIASDGSSLVAGTLPVEVPPNSTCVGRGLDGNNLSCSGGLHVASSAPRPWAVHQPFSPLAVDARGVVYGTSYRAAAFPTDLVSISPGGTILSRVVTGCTTTGSVLAVTSGRVYVSCSGKLIAFGD